MIEDYISDAFIDGAKLCEPHVELLIACRGALEALNIYANEMHMRRLLAKIDALLKGEE